MKTKKTLPYYLTTKLFSNLSNSSKFRKQTRILFLLNKIVIYSLGLMAYVCPINNLRVKFHKWRGVNIGKNVFIGMRCTLDHAYPEYIYIDDNVILSGDIYVCAHNKPSIHFNRKVPSFVAPVKINKNTFIGVRSVIMPGISIGKGVFVSGGSVIFNDIPDNVIVRGNPAEIIHKL